MDLRNSPLLEALVYMKNLCGGEIRQRASTLYLIQGCDPKRLRIPVVTRTFTDFYRRDFTSPPKPADGETVTWAEFLKAQGVDSSYPGFAVEGTRDGKLVVCATQDDIDLIGVPDPTLLERLEGWLYNAAAYLLPPPTPAPLPSPGSPADPDAPAIPGL